ncbi:hypothetical protein [Chromobacterium violaceum]|uniref:RiboL-PSP-HEPN domain-containing protein n=1 Tax=Chromobacterium violaceum (strain ATCC 12472 / DSM 30191 / JCM 1249 / CCUG 213 / NBRC 12614 / NCIMB 9131 / NCTC 9757 / MK) TaxID=243365 RepID=Q7NW54_CHRVO|nr:hypothetical protein [Chromobacterium violaceum]AAQ59809.1 conserved hypothetical protein [Chromobacterium violaceum ATCC 12472]SUX35347.1 Uncharacterised protein [Chromobacterium violaceum]
MSKTDQVFVETKKERQMIMYAELWHASDCVLEKARQSPEGSSWQFLSSILLTAFAFEAYQNHIGPRLFAHWDHLDRLPPLAKFDLIIDRLEIDVPNAKSGRPWQTLRNLFEFRNTIAHGRSKNLKRVTRKTKNAYQEAFHDLRDDWELRIKDDKFALRCREDVEAVLRIIHAQLPGKPEGLFTFGLGSFSVTTLPQAPR